MLEHKAKSQILIEIAYILFCYDNLILNICFYTWFKGYSIIDVFLKTKTERKMLSVFCLKKTAHCLICFTSQRVCDLLLLSVYFSNLVSTMLFFLPCWLWLVTPKVPPRMRNYFRVFYKAHLAAHAHTDTCLHTGTHTLTTTWGVGLIDWAMDSSEDCSVGPLALMVK